MIYTDIRVGDSIRILHKPNRWNSRLASKSPMELTFPFEGIVLKIGDKEYPYCANIDGYGFALNELNGFEILNKNYEIY